MDFEILVGGERPRQLPGSAYYVDGPVFQRYAEAMLKQLGRPGVRIVVGHGRGPSTDLFVAKKTEWESRFGMKVLTLQGLVGEKELGFMIDHVGANETSIMLATNPELVRMQNLPTDSMLTLGRWNACSGKNSPDCERELEVPGSFRCRPVRRRRRHSRASAPKGGSRRGTRQAQTRRRAV
jgi:hypothetical protein